MEIQEADIIKTMQWTVDNILIPHFMALDLNATGEWRENVKVRAENGNGIISGRKYTNQLVNGRGPGKMPPIAPLEKWAQAKLGLSGQQARSAAFAIAKKIAQEGTEIYKDGGTDLLEILESPDTKRKIAENLQQRYAVQVKLFLEREIKKQWQQ